MYANAQVLESERIQTLRGVACVLLVAYHVVGADITRGLNVADGSAYRAFTNIFIHLRMPLFTFLSGFVYAYRPVMYGARGHFARKKLQRLLIPLLVVSTLYFVLQRITPGTNTKEPWEDIWKIYVLPYNHFWFLQAIILIFAATLALEMKGWLRRFDQYLLVFAAVLLVHFTARISPNVFSIDQAFYLAPFFFAGLGANRFHAQLWDRRMKFSMLVLFAVTFSLHVLAVVHVYGTPLQQLTIPATALSMGGIFTLMYWLPCNKSLAWLGGFSFAIYLYHVFFTAGARIVLHKLGMQDVNANFMFGCTLGVMGPVFVELFVRRSRVARRLLLGQS